MTPLFYEYLYYIQWILVLCMTAIFLFIMTSYRVLQPDYFEIYVGVLPTYLFSAYFVQFIPQKWDSKNFSKPIAAFTVCSSIACAYFKQPFLALPAMFIYMDILTLLLRQSISGLKSYVSTK